jgi:endonuclease/exonuclease/phosphatase family metal-dependent hydrolase
VPTTSARRFVRAKERTGPDPRDAAPPEQAAELAALRAALDERVPKKELDHNLLIATWNLRKFGKVNPKWIAADGEKPERDIYSMKVIAEIVSRFDVVAIQEVQANIDALRMLVRTLGSNWGLILTDAVKGDRGGNERLAFVYDTRRATPSGLACELVVPPEVLDKGVGKDALKEQFARTPYAVAFRSEGTTFILVTLHVLFGEPAQRLPELKAIAKWMRDWADDTADEHQNLMTLGDFNINRKGDELFEAFTDCGLSPPPELEKTERTLPTADGKPKFYDQIAWFTEDGDAKLTLGYDGCAGNFEFDDYVFDGMPRNEISYRISDHYPLWCEFLLPERG